MKKKKNKGGNGTNVRQDDMVFSKENSLKLNTDNQHKVQTKKKTSDK